MTQAFIVFIAIVGAISGVVVAQYPATSNYALLWILIAMAVFEAIVGAMRGIQLGTLVTMPQRMLGLAIGVALLMVIPMLMTKSAA
ncbi:hypothetical protein GJW-30_1_00224 [Variibacter gotjawalensis]|uniref:Uncharacterized protein n=1 Tax=Variibacter gotjawalensis TaxID=1333996 RepID=A0A0S3PP54_9BRAD|nr:hypothetical protein [Variibacter gotjawalensis]NIK48011.1 hypothetical protein [Variibacter gotjawalensis]RZS49888.1 hypothetical protein EV661_2334 [Variibacter gotjawalensis]BAT57716.1 hypothetical protein GJW-30_1_00224 [Variibacter gotjawalensis]